MTRKKVKKTAVVLAACVAATAMFSGCGSKEKDPYKAVDYNVDDYVTLGSYKELSVDEKVKVVTDADIQSAIDELIEQNITYKEVTEKAALENKVTLSYTKSADGAQVGSQDDYTLELGSGDMGEEFENHIVGMSAGDKVTFTIAEEVEGDTEDADAEDTDADSNTEDAEAEDGEVEDSAAEDSNAEGNTEHTHETKDYTYEVTVNKVEEKVTPTFDDAFVASKTESKTVSEYKEAKKKELEETNKESAVSTAKSELLNQVVEASKVTGAPTFLFNINYNSLLSSYAQYGSMFGMDLEGYVEACGSSMDELKYTTVDRTKHVLVAESIAKSENISVSDEDYNKKIDEMIEGGWESKEAIEKEISKEEINMSILEDKVLDYLYENSTVNSMMVESNDEDAE